MTSIKNVVIIGAGGNLGPSILSALLESSSFNVSVLSRESSSATFPSGVNVIKANYDSFDSLKAAFQGQDAVLSLVGGMAIGDQNKLIDAAVAAGVKRFLPSEYGSNTQDERVVEMVPAFKGKTGAVDYLKSKESDTFSWSSLINGPFFDWGLKVGFIGFDLANKKVQLIDGGKGRFSATTLRQIGLAVIKILENPTETKNKYIFISSFTTSQNEILAALEEISGDKYTTTEVTHKDLIAQGGQKLSQGDFSGIMELIQGAAFGDHGLGDLTPVGLWNDKLGLPNENFKDTIKSVLN